MSDFGKNLFVTGIDTGIGKTVVSSIFCEALQANYWKPVQCGDLDSSDTQKVASWVRFTGFQTFPEAYRLTHPKSPHQAAAWQGMTIDLNKICLPPSDRAMVVEGAGGVLVPLNHEHWIVDIAAKFHLSVVLVTKNYLGSLNHTFLTIETLRQRGLSILGLVFNGPSDQELESFVAQRAKLPILLQVREETSLTPNVIARYAKQLREKVCNGLVESR